MTQLLDQALATVRGLSDEAQDEIAILLLQLVREDDERAIPMSAEEDASFDESLAQAERGELVSEDTLRAFWTTHAL